MLCSVLVISKWKIAGGLKRKLEIQQSKPPKTHTTRMEMSGVKLAEGCRELWQRRGTVAVVNDVEMEVGFYEMASIEVWPVALEQVEL